MTLPYRTAIVTGSSSGIGLAVSKALIGTGVHVAGWSRSKAPLDDPHYTHFITDISDIHSVEQSFSDTLSSVGMPDILVNNAGIGFMSEFETLEPEKWHRMFDVNVHGIFYCTRMVIPGMKEKGNGHIINIGSIAGKNPVKNMVGYSASKHAVTGLSHSLFMEVRNHGIKVTCLFPGSVKTRFFDPIDSMDVHDNMMDPEDIAKTVIHLLESPPNYHIMDLEVRPLKPKGG